MGTNHRPRGGEFGPRPINREGPWVFLFLLSLFFWFFLGFGFLSIFPRFFLTFFVFPFLTNFKVEQILKLRKFQIRIFFQSKQIFNLSKFVHI
jgi:hypothetical protein